MRRIENLEAADAWDTYKARLKKEKFPVARLRKKDFIAGYVAGHAKVAELESLLFPEYPQERDFLDE